MQAFSDINVLDLTQSVAGPFATMHLGTFGANVVKIEPPGGDDFRGNLNGSIFASYNLGDKRSLSVDLKTAEGQEIVQELAAKADVLVESFRPGVLERFGLDYDSVTEDNDDIVYCSISGFGDDGPYSEWPAYDPIVQAMSGMMSTTGYPDRAPVRAGTSPIDCGTGVTAGFAIATSLLKRMRTGEGEYIEVSLFEVATSWMSYWLANYDETGHKPKRSQPGGFAGMAPYGVFETGDGGQFYMSVANDVQFARLCSVLGEDELADDERFRDKDSRWTNRQELYEVVTDRFAEYDRDELVDRLVDAGVPAGPVLEVDEVIADPHLAERNMFQSVENIHSGNVIEAANVPIVTKDGRPDPGSHPPTVGEHTREILGEIGYEPSQIDRLFEVGAVHGNTVDLSPPRQE
jgi:crotonobetainyl-CoA:carnitine CoA-transferase CaiB-like acyl-CoA transferase